LKLVNRQIQGAQGITTRSVSHIRAALFFVRLRSVTTALRPRACTGENYQEYGQGDPRESRCRPSAESFIHTCTPFNPHSVGFIYQVNEARQVLFVTSRDQLQISGDLFRFLCRDSKACASGRARLR
jgi:hypothetical protein